MCALGAVVERLPNPVFRLLFRLFLYHGQDDWACAKESIGQHWPFYAARS
jgi:hypothetical protein